MNNIIQRMGITVWRRKTTVLLSSALFTIIFICIQYTKFDETKNVLLNEERDAKSVQDALLRSINVKFIEASKTAPTRADILSDSNNVAINTEGKDEIIKRQIEELETEQQMGIPYISYDRKNPYMPKKRLVHFDLKGAPPLLGYFKKIIPLIKNMGATGILLEYEDMFPFTGILKPLSAKNAYSLKDIKSILNVATDHGIEVIPLIQTFGHMEFALKHAAFKHLREVSGSPQALCPSRNTSLDFVRELVNQVMSLHSDSKYLHIGCDEVFEMGECDLCRLQMHETLFLKHIQNVGSILREKYPKLRLIIWDDMLRHLSQQAMLEVRLGDVVEPMVWVYAEDIYRFVQPQVWEKYAAVFRTAWTASAFKGAFGETLYIPNAKRHLENNLHWLDVMATQSAIFKHGFAGIVLTGWQRYDHFAVLCELLPAAFPSLALNLITTSHGFFNSSLKDLFLTSLNCPQPSSGRSGSNPFINLDSDPFLWEKLSRCMFPGSEIFRLTYRLHNAESEAIEYLDTTTRQRGWLTAYNARHNYSLPLRIDELTNGDLARLHHGMLGLIRSSVAAMTDIFDIYTISEWIEQRIYPFVLQLEKIQNDTAVMKKVVVWPVRPLEPLRDLQRLGVPLE